MTPKHETRQRLPHWEDIKPYAGDVTVSQVSSILTQFIEWGRKRNPKKARIGELANDWPNGDVYVMLRMLDSSRFPHPERHLNVDQKVIHEAVAEALFEGDLDQVEEGVDEHGSVSRYLRVVEVPERLKMEDVPIAALYSDALKLSEMSHDDAQRDLMVERIGMMNYPHVFTYLLDFDLTLYTGSYMIRDALRENVAPFTDLNETEMKAAYGITNDIAHLFLDGKGITSPGFHLILQPHDPHGTMKAESTDANEVADDLARSEWVGQTKYDGARLFVHHSGDGDVRAYMGGGKDITNCLPELQELALPETSFIFDCEATPYDPDTGEPVPFQNILSRTSRDASKELKVAGDMDCEVRFKFFDALYWDGEDITTRSHEDRFNVVESVFMPPNVARTGTDLEAVFRASIEGGHEGVVLKRTDSQHRPGYRESTWLKWKPEPETLDCKVVGVQKGDGRISDRMGALELSLAGPDGGNVDVGYVGTGFSDEERLELWEQYNDDELLNSIVEVETEELQYDGSGWGLRFPSFKVMRPEGEIDTLKRAADLFGMKDEYEEWLPSEDLGDLFD